MKKLMYCVFASSLLFVGCADGGDVRDVDPDVVTLKVPINITTNLSTRATDAAFEEGDKVGLYVVNFSNGTAGTLAATDNHVDNMGFSYSGTWTPDKTIYWKDESTKADFYCYYPYASSVSSVSAYPFTVKSDQSAEADYKASDFLWGKTESVTPSESAVPITVKHKLSNLFIYLKAGNGYTDAELEQARITICQVKTGATIDLATGAVTTTGSAVDMTPRAETGYFRALVVPQNIQDANFIKVSVSGYEYVLKQTINLEPNKRYKCTLTVNKTSEGINVGIGGWETDEKDYGGTVE